MAVSKIKAIKNTLRKAIDYISNPDKTDGSLLVSSFGCSPETADLEFELTAKKSRNAGNDKERIAYHMIQSFAPYDDITPEKAHELGVQFAREMTKGQYEYIVTTHIDKGHIHNHIIFNATSYTSHKKYHHSVGEKYRMRRINDKICRDNNLYVIENPGRQRGKSKYEYEQSKAGTSWKDKLREMIDELVLKVESYEEFIQMLELEGCEIKGAVPGGSGKYISFKPMGADKFTRGSERGLGAEYTKERINERILNKDISKEAGVIENENPEENPENQKSGIGKKAEEQKGGQKKKVSRPDPDKINLLVDVSNNIKAQQSRGYEHALMRSNIDNLVKTMNYLVRHNIKTKEDFNIYYSGKMAEYNLIRKSLKKYDNDMIDLSEMIKFTKSYNQNKYTFWKFERMKNPEREVFYNENRDAIIQYQTAMVYFEENKLDPKSLNLSKLFEKYRAMKQERSDTYKIYNDMKKNIKEMQTVEKNLSEVLGTNFADSSVSENEVEKQSGRTEKKDR